MELVPSKNISGDVGHWQILGNVNEDLIESLVGCRQGVHTGMICPNLQLKLNEKINAKKIKTNKLK